jgi:metal-responsive CopG/Arc/MetJ family transcriptional regulator
MTPQEAVNFLHASMKTAISIPDPVFNEAERLGKRLNISRSQLYAKAVENYIAQNRKLGITEVLDHVYADEASELDKVTQALQVRSLPQNNW